MADRRSREKRPQPKGFALKPAAARVLINAVALWVASSLLDGIELSSGFWRVLLVGAIFGLVNALIRPVALLLSLPFLILTLGLFTFVVNALMLLLTDAITSSLTVDGFGSALGGAVIISIVSWALSTFLVEQRR
jgi:putative membrane protein